jgi:integrase
MKGKRGSGRGWLILGTKRDGHFVLSYRTDSKIAGISKSIWRQHRIPLEIQTKRDAEIYATEFVKNLVSEAVPTASPVSVPEPQPPAEPTLRELAKKWLEFRNGLVTTQSIRPATHKQDKGNWSTHIEPVLGDTLISKILDHAIIREFIRTKAATKANLTVRNIACTLKTMLDDIDAEGWFPIPVNPMRHKKVVKHLPKPRTKAGKKVIVHIVKEDVVKLLRCRTVETEHKVRYLLGLTTGLRDGELRGLQLHDLRLAPSKPEVSVRLALALYGIDGKHTLQAPKTEDGVRSIPLQKIMFESLQWWLANGWVRRVGRPAENTDFVFPNSEGRPIRPNTALMLRADLKKAGCAVTYEGHNITAHALRRTFSTMLDDFPEAHRVKHDLMGHSGKGVDELHYRSTSQETKRRAIDSIRLDVTLADITNGEVEAPPTTDVNAAE